jgi:hypothetical protein
LLMRLACRRKSGWICRSWLARIEVLASREPPPTSGFCVPDDQSPLEYTVSTSGAITLSCHEHSQQNRRFLSGFGGTPLAF